MKYISNTLNVSTNKEEEMINVSSEVKQLLNGSGHQEVLDWVRDFA